MNRAADLARLGHRVSGVALAVFLPLHFYVLSWVLTSAAEFNRALVFGQHWAVRALEWMLVALLTVHLVFGLRILAIELAARGDSTLPANLRYRWLPAGIVLAIVLATTYLVTGDH